MLTAFIFSACLDEITLENSIDLEDNIAIQGSLIKGSPSIVNVFVSRLSNLTGVNLPVAILDADVSILDENGTELLLDNINSGFYELEIPENDPNFIVDINRKFQLKVKADGNEYLSNMEILLPIPEITSLGFNVTAREVINEVTGIGETRDFIEFNVNTPLVISGVSTKSQMIWELEGTYQLTDSPLESCNPIFPVVDPKTCYVTEKINLDKKVLFDGTTASTNDLTGFPVFESRINFRFSEGYYMTFLQQSLTSGAHKYWKTTNDMLQRTGSIFEAPAGKIESNFTNASNPDELVFGYFYATQQDTARIYIDPSFVDFPATNCPIPFDPLGPVTQCCDCLDTVSYTHLTLPTTPYV